jgi:hypothetical protein
MYKKLNLDLLPKILSRRSDWLDRDGIKHTAHERIKVLIEDEEKLYNITSRNLTGVKVPDIISLENSTLEQINLELLKLVKLKHKLENDAIECISHVSFLSKKIADLKHSTPSELPGITPGTISQLISRLKDYFSLFVRLQGIFKSKISMINDNMRVTRTMETKFKNNRG